MKLEIMALSAIHLGVLILLTLAAGGLVHHFMKERGFAFSPCLTYLFLVCVVVALYIVGGFSMWTVKGIALALILLYASAQDLYTHEADDFVWGMLLILSLVNFGDVGIGSMIMGALGVFVPQILVAIFAKKGGIGGADIKISTAAALSLGFCGGVLGYMLGLIFAIVFQAIRSKVMKSSRQEPFPLLPFLSTGLMIGYFM